MFICHICRNDFPPDVRFTAYQKKLEDLMEVKQQNAATVGKCGHLFHTHCIHQWIQQLKVAVQETCPSCSQKSATTSERVTIRFHKQGSTTSLHGYLPVNLSSSEAHIKP